MLSIFNKLKEKSLLFDTARINFLSSHKIGLTANTLKYWAIIAMLIDHIAWGFVETNSPLGFVMHFIGRTTAPIMCYFIAEGYHYTSSFKKYILRMGVFCLISQIPYMLFMDAQWWHFNVMFTYLIGLLCLKLFDTKGFPLVVKILLTTVLAITTYTADWGISAIVWILIFGLFRENTIIKFILFAIAAFLEARFYVLTFGNEYYMMLGLLMAIPLLLLYTGKLGKKSKIAKYGFYGFYPVHLAILEIIKSFI